MAITGPKTRPMFDRSSIASTKDIETGGFVHQAQGEAVGDGEPGQPADLTGDEGAVDTPSCKVALVHPLDVGLLVVRADGVPDLRDKRVRREGQPRAFQRRIIRLPAPS